MNSTIRNYRRVYDILMSKSNTFFFLKKQVHNIIKYWSIKTVTESIFFLFLYCINTCHYFKDLHRFLSCRIWASLFPKRISVWAIFGITPSFFFSFCSKYVSFFESCTDQEIMAQFFLYSVKNFSNVSIGNCNRGQIFSDAYPVNDRVARKCSSLF